MIAFCRGRIYPSRGTHVRQFGDGQRPLKQSEVISGRINPSPTFRRIHADLCGFLHERIRINP
ncbi:MAG: hypothetical protein FWG87_06645 [Defluviitaleaceae bacterium]|nr:hypothetical protein [Defluviitaleaceae bacterium]